MKICDDYEHLSIKGGSTVGQASVLTNSDIRRVFRILETTRHVEQKSSRICALHFCGIESW